jgi:hypothetical protein
LKDFFKIQWKLQRIWDIVDDEDLLKESHDYEYVFLNGVAVQQYHRHLFHSKNIFWMKQVRGGGIYFLNETSACEQYTEDKPPHINRHEHVKLRGNDKQFYLKYNV